MSHRGPLERETVLNRRLERKASQLQPNPRINRFATIAQAISIPIVIGYFVFVIDFGEKEHVFSEPRRWLARQKAAFWTISPSQRSAAEGLRPVDSMPNNASTPTTS